MMDLVSSSSKCFPVDPVCRKSPRPKNHHSATLFCFLRSQLQPIAIIQGKSASRPTEGSINLLRAPLHAEGSAQLLRRDWISQLPHVPLSNDPSTSLTTANIPNHSGRLSSFQPWNLQVPAPFTRPYGSDRQAYALLLALRQDMRRFEVLWHSMEYHAMQRHFKERWSKPSSSFSVKAPPKLLTEASSPLKPSGEAWKAATKLGTLSKPLSKPLCIFYVLRVQTWRRHVHPQRSLFLLHYRLSTFCCSWQSRFPYRMAVSMSTDKPKERWRWTVLSSAGSSAWLLALSTLAVYCSNSVAENGTSILVRAAPWSTGSALQILFWFSLSSHSESWSTLSGKSCATSLFNLRISKGATSIRKLSWLAEGTLNLKPQIVAPPLSPPWNTKKSTVLPQRLNGAASTGMGKVILAHHIPSPCQSPLASRV